MSYLPIGRQACARMMLLLQLTTSSMTFLPMSTKDIDRYGIINRLLQKEINGTEAAEFLKISVRQVKRLKAAVKQRGVAGLIHGNRAKPGNRKIPEKERATIAALLHQHYVDFKPSFAAEKLVENHNIHRDPKTMPSMKEYCLYLISGKST